MDLADVGVIEDRDGTGFLLEADAVLALESLNGDDAVQPRVARIPHFAHAARADACKDLVRSEFVAGREGHGDAAILS